jgi:hypothetical protein
MGLELRVARSLARLVMYALVFGLVTEFWDVSDMVGWKLNIILTKLINVELCRNQLEIVLQCIQPLIEG